jgi:hypothetical protein
MIEPHVEHGGASSWFCIAENFEAFGAGAASGAGAGLAIAATSSVSCSGVVTVSCTFRPTRSRVSQPDISSTVTRVSKYEASDPLPA